MLPPAPVTFSTTTVCPMLFAIRSAMIRAIVSVGPPAENGTTIVTGRVGKFCADEVLQNTIAAAISRNRFMAPLCASSYRCVQRSGVSVSRSCRIRGLDRAREPRAIRIALHHRGANVFDRGIGIAAALLLRAGALHDFLEIVPVARYEARIAERAVARHDHDGLQCLEPIEAREPLLDARIGARKGRLCLHGEIAGKEHSVALDPDTHVPARVIRAEREE